MRIALVAVFALLAACSTPQRYTGIATACSTYAVALNTLAALNRAGKLSLEAQGRIDATVGPAKAACSGPAPSDDPAAVQKVADAVIAVLKEAAQ